MFYNSSLLTAEMEKVGDLLKSEKDCQKRLKHDMVSPLVLQLGGSNIELLSAVVKKAASYNYDEINLNCGCPSIRGGAADFGAS